MLRRRLRLAAAWLVLAGIVALPHLTPGGGRWPWPLVAGLFLAALWGLKVTAEG